MDVEQRARELLARCLDEWGYPCEAENIREGQDLESNESELRPISQLLCFGMDTADGHGRAALTPPEGYVLVPVEPTDEMLGDGAESRPMLPFTPLEEWEAFEAMSGCEQGWHKARLCWAAMLAARPEVP